jgi:DNA-binding NarL/FixJ family response regulator
VVKARVFIVDEHEPVRLALADRLTRAAQIRVLGHSGNADEAIAEIHRTQPEIVLLEVKRSDGLGLELLRQVAEMPNPPKVLVLTSYPTEWEAEAATRAGAHSYLLKDIDTEELIRRIAEFAAE